MTDSLAGCLFGKLYFSVPRGHTSGPHELLLTSIPFPLTVAGEGGGGYGRLAFQTERMPPGMSPSKECPRTCAPFCCPIGLAFGFMFYSISPILIYTKIRLHFAAVAVCPSCPCIMKELSRIRLLSRIHMS